MPDIIIRDFHRGQASSPYVADGAFAKSANLDVFSQPGIARINYLPIKKSESVITNLIKWMSARPDLTSTIYAGDENDLTYVSANSGDSWATLTAARGGKGGIVWKDHLIAAEATAINTYGPLSSSPNWFVDFVTGLDSGTHFMFVSKNDGNLYICNGDAVSQLVEDTDFADGDVGTYTWTLNKLTLPEGHTAVCISEQKENLLIGTSQGTIFIWDRSTTEYDFPVSVPQESINSMFEVQNRIFVSAGNQGKIYLFSEAGLIPYAQIKYDYDNGEYITVYPQGLAWWKDKLLVGTNSPSSGIAFPMGTYGIQNKKVNLEHLISTGKSGEDTHVVQIGSVYTPTNTNLLIAWRSGPSGTETFGVDRLIDTYKRYTGYTAYFESLLYRIGTTGNRGNIKRIEINLARPLQTGEGIKIKYRENASGNWTTLKTISFTTAMSFFNFPGPKGLDNIQLRVELTTGASSKNTPWLYEIRLVI